MGWVSNSTMFLTLRVINTLPLSFGEREGYLDSIRFIWSETSSPPKERFHPVGPPSKPKGEGEGRGRSSHQGE